MKMIIVTFALVAVTLASGAAVPVDPVKVVTQILRSQFDQTPDGGYNFQFETDDGTKRDEVGELKSVLDEDNKPHEVIVVRGSYSYVNKDGVVETVNFIADQNGFQPTGDSIPKRR